MKPQNSKSGKNTAPQSKVLALPDKSGSIKDRLEALEDAFEIQQEHLIECLAQMKQILEHLTK